MRFHGNLFIVREYLRIYEICHKGTSCSFYFIDIKFQHDFIEIKLFIDYQTIF